MKLEKSKLNEISEDIKSCWIEAIFTSKFALVQAYHYTGELLVKNFDDLPAVLSDLSKKTGRSERTLYRAVQFYKAFPDLDKLPGGKAISMNQIITQYLMAPGEKKECEHLEIIKICANCRIKV